MVEYVRDILRYFFIIGNIYGCPRLFLKYLGYFQVFWSNYEYFQIFCGISDILIVFNSTFYDCNGILRGILKC